MFRMWCPLLLMAAASQAVASVSTGDSSFSPSVKREEPSGPSAGKWGPLFYSPSGSFTFNSSAAFNTSDIIGYKPQQNSQGNLYYYFYPVQDKARDNTYVSFSSDNYATSPAHTAYESQDSVQNNYAVQTGSNAYMSKDATAYGKPLNQYGLANGYSLGAANHFGAYGGDPTGYTATAIPAGYPGGIYTLLYGMGSLIVPMFTLAGLTTFFPTIRNLGSRTKRSTDAMERSPQIAHFITITEYKNMLEKYYSLYQTAIKNEKCKNRIICELGTTFRNVKGKGVVVLILEKLLTKHLRNKMNAFKAGALSLEIGRCNKLFKC